MAAHWKNDSVLEFRDDDAQGFAFRVVRGGDGDFHLSVVPWKQDFDHEHEGEEATYRGCWNASIRVRSSMIGGGAHHELYMALAKVWKAESQAHWCRYREHAGFKEGCAQVAVLNRRGYALCQPCADRQRAAEQRAHPESG